MHQTSRRRQRPVCRRPLSSSVLVETFMVDVLGQSKNRSDFAKVSAEIVRLEGQVRDLEANPSASARDFRHHSYREKAERDELRETIFRELVTLTRLKNDDRITLGHGGARPKKIEKDGHAFIVSGPPASGKSRVATQLADTYGAYILDADYAKRKFPEYPLHEASASLLHEESHELIFAKKDSLLEYCASHHYNIVIPTVGRTVSSVNEIICALLSAGYIIHICNVVLDRYLCAERAYNRFKKTHRYVPLAYIFDEVGNEPEIVYFRLKRQYEHHPKFAEFMQISTNVPYGSKYITIEYHESIFANGADSCEADPDDGLLKYRMDKLIFA